MAPSSPPAAAGATDDAVDIPVAPLGDRVEGLVHVEDVDRDQLGKFELLDALRGQLGLQESRWVQQSERRHCLRACVHSQHPRARLPDREAAGKTGTTQAARDAWFLGFTADYVAGVWMGYDDNSPLQGVTGGGLPAEIWRETMVRVNEGLQPRQLPMARNIRSAPVAQDAPETPRPSRSRSGETAVERILRDLLGTR